MVAWRGVILHVAPSECECAGAVGTVVSICASACLHHHMTRHPPPTFSISAISLSAFSKAGADMVPMCIRDT